jgi:hypothetical protein
MLRRLSARSITATWYCPGELTGGRLASATRQANEQTAEASAD